MRARATGRTLFLYFLRLLWLEYAFPYNEDYSTHSVEHFFSQRHIASLKKTDDSLLKATEKTEPSTCRGLGNEPGHCEYPRKCLSGEYRSDFDLAMNHSCIVDRTHIGICCSDLKEETKKVEVNFANILPIIAKDDGEWVEEMAPKNGSRIVWREEEDGLRPLPQGMKEAFRDWDRSRGCGTTSRSHGRIVGGRPADPQDWPWMVALLKNNGIQYCGGVLITDRHILTAAHCVHRFKRRDIIVRLGEYDLSTTTEAEAVDFAVSEIRIHPDYDYNSYENDIAIVKMHKPTVFNGYIWPVCLPPVYQTFENRNAVVTGWGTSYYGGPVSSVLMEVGVPIWSQEKCARSFVQRIPRTVMCAGAYEGGGDACQGDSGGPLLHQLANGRWVNVGIVSWGIRCGEKERPGIYTRVNSYLDWIFENAVF